MIVQSTYLKKPEPSLYLYFIDDRELGLEYTTEYDKHSTDSVHSQARQSVKSASSPSKHDISYVSQRRPRGPFAANTGVGMIWTPLTKHTTGFNTPRRCLFLAHTYNKTTLRVHGTMPLLTKHRCNVQHLHSPGLHLHLKEQRINQESRMSRQHVPWTTVTASVPAAVLVYRDRRDLYAQSTSGSLKVCGGKCARCS